MKIYEYGDYINGKRYFKQKQVSQYRMTEEDAKECLHLLETQDHIRNVLQVHYSPNAFYTSMPDLKFLIPKEKREEYFYTMKCNNFSTTVPSMLIYYIKTAIREYDSPNYFLYLMSKKQLELVFSEGYLLDGLTVRDYINSELKVSNYKPINVGSYKSKIASLHTDVYIESNNSIAMLPNKLADALSFEDIRNIEYVKGKLCLGGNSIDTLLDYVGANNNSYDLRSIM